MPKKMSRYVLEEQPINWGRAVACGAISAVFMMAFIDTFYLMGFTPFSFELFLGSLIRDTPYGAQNWVAGFLANLVTGAIFGTFYAYCFEYIFYRASGRIGVWVGVWHLAAAALVFFPFFTAIHEFMGLGLYPSFGILGSGLGAPTFLLLLMGHFLFGASMGTFYGPVGVERVQSRLFEPGEVGVPPEEGGISVEDDPEDRVAV